jgi:hypothetical protein
MAKQILSIPEHSHTENDLLENPDGTVVKMAHSLNAAGIQNNLLLRGNAVNYAVRASVSKSSALPSEVHLRLVLGLIRSNLLISGAPPAATALSA